jgi:hypothetical protein
MSDDSLEKWIIQLGQREEARSRIIPASTDRLLPEGPGDGETAMAKVANAISRLNETPQVELAVLSPQSIRLTFSEETTLPEPWVPYNGDRNAPCDQWGIGHDDAMTLEWGQEYNHRVAGLTGIGTLADGSRALLNTSRWEILQIAGTKPWVHDLLVTQVMNQAAEPWSSSHDIWMVGFEDTADKLMNFLVKEHPRHHFKTASSLNEIQAGDLSDNTATIYVMGATESTKEHFEVIKTPGVGLIADTIITDDAMFLSERDGGAAILGPFSTDLEIYPNLRPDLIEKMEYAWQATEEIARQKAAEIDFDDLLKPGPEQQPKQDKDFPPFADYEQDSFAEQHPKTPNDVVQEHKKNATQDLPDDSVETENLEGETVIQLQLMGNFSIQGPEEAVTGRNAATVAILYLENKPLAPQKLSELLWPGDDAQGQTARTRRNRLKNKIEELLGPILSVDADGWSLSTDQITSDYAQVMDRLSDVNSDDSEAVEALCGNIKKPLDVAESWAATYRSSLIEELTHALSQLKEKAVNEESYDTAKTLKGAISRIGGN